MPEQLAISWKPRTFPRNPAKRGTQNWIVHETLVNAGGILATGELQARCLRAGVSNFRARISDLREMGINIQVENGIYELMKE